MPVEAYRLCNIRYADDLSGNGARIYGGRWNSKGVPVIYLSASKALAILELLVHTSTNLLPPNLIMITFSFSDKIKIKEINIDELPDNWRTYPAEAKTQMFGDKWIKSKETPILKIPSVIIPTEYNYLLNPVHSDIKKIRIVKKEKFEIDKRIVDKLN